MEAHEALLDILLAFLLLPENMVQVCFGPPDSRCPSARERRSKSLVDLKEQANHAVKPSTTGTPTSPNQKLLYDQKILSNQNM